MEIASGGGSSHIDCVEPTCWEEVWPSFPIFSYQADSIMKESSTAYKHRETRSPVMFIFDTAAATSIARDLSCCIPGTFIPCNKESLKITGIGGSNIDVIGSARLQAPFSHIRVWIVPDAIANIMSAVDVQSKMVTQWRDQFNSKHRIECVFDNRVIAEFRRQKSGFFEFGYDPDDVGLSDFHCTSFDQTAPLGLSDYHRSLLEPRAASVLVFKKSACAKVDDAISDAQSQGVSVTSIKRALKVELLHKSLSYVGLERLENIVRSSAYGFDGILPSDVAIYRKYIHRKRCIACALGKSTSPPASISERPKATRVGERIIADIFFISSEALAINDIYLLTVDEFAGMIHARRLESRDKEEVAAAFKSIIADYGKHNHTIGAIRFDNEGSFAEMGSLLSRDNGIRLEPCVSERHARVAERAIRTICGLFRTSLAGLPFVLAPHLYYRLIDYVVTSNNLVTNSHNSILSAHELFTNKSPDYARYLSFKFGDLVVFHEGASSSDVMPGTMGMVVGRDIMTPGAAIIWDIYNGGSKSRFGFKPVDWTNAVADLYIAKSTSLDGGEKYKKWLDKRLPFYTAADLTTPDDFDFVNDEKDESKMDTGVVSAIPSNSSDPSALCSTCSPPDDDILSKHKSLIAQMGTGDPQGPLRDVDDVYIGKSDRDPLEFLEGRDKYTPKEKKTRVIFPGYDGANVLPSKTRSKRVLHMSIKECEAIFEPSKVSEALAAELRQMFLKHVWIALDREAVKKGYKEGSIKNIITSSIFLKDKYDASNRFLKLKARLVAHGNRQIIDEVFGAKATDSPTASLAGVFILLHLAAANGWGKTVADIGGAYLNGSLKDPEYMRISRNVVNLVRGTDSAFDSSMIQDDGSVIVKLEKALYGLRQSGRIWYDLLSSKLEGLGYVRSDIDRCIFTKIEGTSTTHIAVYVDDLLVVGNDPKARSDLMDALRSEFIEISIQSEEDMSFVGLEIHTDKDRNVKIRQLGYIDDVLAHFKIAKDDFQDHPCSANIMDQPKAGDKSFDKSIFLSGVMKLMYLSTRSRPDIAFAVSALACRSSDPKESDWNSLLRIARFLNKTREDYLVFKFGGEIKLSAYVDASFMCHRDMRGHTGYAIFADSIGSAGVVYRSVKQTTVANSSTEAEVIALHDLVQHLLWVQGIYDSLGVDYEKPSIIHDDNEATIKLNSSPIVNFSGRSKYIARKYFSVYEHVENGEVILRWCGTDDMIADFLTKAIIGNKFAKFRIQIMGHSEEGRVSHDYSDPL